MKQHMQMHQTKKMNDYDLALESAKALLQLKSSNKRPIEEISSKENENSSGRSSHSSSSKSPDDLKRHRSESSSCSLEKKELSCTHSCDVEFSLKNNFQTLEIFNFR